MMHSAIDARNVWCGLKQWQRRHQLEPGKMATCQYQKWWQYLNLKWWQRWHHSELGMVATTVAPSLACAANRTGGDGCGTVASWHRSEQSSYRTVIIRVDTVERCHGRCLGCATTADVVVFMYWGVVPNSCGIIGSIYATVPRCHGQFVQPSRRL